MPEPVLCCWRSILALAVLFATGNSGVSRRSSHSTGWWGGRQPNCDDD